MTRVVVSKPRTTVVVAPRETTLRVATSSAGVSACCENDPVVVERENTIVVDRTKTEVVKVGTPGPPGPAGRDGVDAGGVVPPVAFGWGDAPRTVFVAPRAGLLTVVRVQYTVPFDGVGAQLAVGTLAAPEAIMPAGYNNPHTALEYENTPDLPLAEGEEVRLTISPGTASAGAGLLFLTFLPTT